jgi:hypothetical protein
MPKATKSHQVSPVIHGLRRGNGGLCGTVCMTNLSRSHALVLHCAADEGQDRVLAAGSVTRGTTEARRPTRALAQRVRLPTHLQRASDTRQASIVDERETRFPEI